VTGFDALLTALGSELLGSVKDFLRADGEFILIHVCCFGA
jgi:hypothetical protein